MIHIDSILKEKSISKKEVAKRMGLSRESLYRILSGNPTLDNINKLASALNVPLAELFEKQKGNAFQCPECGKELHVEIK